ncbi:PAS domain-containing sensor histidine kinase [Bacillus sp. FJAT-27225]|uniref:PAS domain-containing sensor histidine kinase n=1 Tax=Bacillus sp. FJAT-27225 TaxID=1743144 RepID=UPI00080C236D|nr:PAS domain-containing sensor histidine kinase [Bacillus sp. FJAT-27225]OCA83045.1 PAS domain-containing sensor histidine kinase [Bacillus sp. FJAT-27225]
MNSKISLVLSLISIVVLALGTNYVLAQHGASIPILSISILKDSIYISAIGILIWFLIKKSKELSQAKLGEQRLSTLINSMVDFVNFKDGNGRWIEVNEYGLELFQLKGFDYREKKDSELAEFSRDYAEALRYCEISDEEAWENGKVTRVEEILETPSGDRRIFDTFKIPLFHSDGSRKGLVVIGRDITENRKLINLLEESQQQYKSLFEYNPDIVYMTDLTGVFTNVNARLKEVTGYEPSTIIGKRIFDLMPNLDRKLLGRYLSAVVNDKTPQTIELGLKTSQGASIIVECTSMPIIINGTITGLIGYGKDVTKLRETEEQLRRSEKLSVVGEMSASVAHEIRNPLTSLLGFVQLLDSEDEKHRSYYKIMKNELNRINSIVGELLLLAKPQEVKFLHSDLSVILLDVITLLETEAAFNNVQLETRIEKQDLFLDCEPNQLKQLFINVIKNAIEASNPGGKVSVSATNTGHGTVAVSIKDKGVGIPKERLEKIGQPFYSSKEKGTGLGLTVSYKIIEFHRGKMTFASEVNKGTKVQIELPTEKHHPVTQSKTG